MNKVCKQNPLNELGFITDDSKAQKYKNTKIQKYKNINSCIYRHYKIRKDQDKSIKIIALHSDKKEYEIIQEALDDLIKKKKNRV